MPIARFQMPDGRVARFEVPDGTTPEQAQTLMVSHFAAPAPQSEIPGERTFGGFASNVGTSAKNFASGIAQAVMHPVDTATGMLDVGAGALQKALPQGLVDFVNKSETPEALAAGQRAVEAATMAGGALKAKYGSVNALKNTLYEDPVGAAADLSMLVTGGASLGRGIANVSRAPLAARAARIQEGRVAQSIANAPQIEAAQKAVGLDIALNPAVSNPNAMNRAVSTITGNRDLEASLATANAPKWTKISVEKGLGLPANTALDAKAIETALDTASKPYDVVRKIPNIVADENTLSTLEALKKPPSAVYKGKVESSNALIDSMIEEVKQGRSGANVLDDIRQLRAEANSVYKARDKGLNIPKASEIAEADARMGIANAYENMIDANVANPKILADLKTARTKIAQIHDIERATDFATGKVDPMVFAKMVSEGKPITGVVADMGQIAANFPSIAKVMPEQLHLAPTITRGGLGGAVGYAMGGPVGAVLGAGAGSAVSGVGSRVMRTPGYQAARAVPTDYRNMLRPVEPNMSRTNALVPYEAEVLNAAPGASDASKLRIVSYDENGVPIYMANERSGQGFTMPPSPSFGASPRPFAQGSLPNEVPRQIYEAQKNAELAREFRATAERKPTGAGVQYDLDPITGKLVPTSAGVKGATPEVWQADTGASLKSATEKIASGQRFDLSAAEKVAWDKTRVDLAAVAPEFKSLSQKQLSEKMMDRQWVADAITKVQDKQRAFDDIAQRAQSADAIRKATIAREQMTDLLTTLEETFRQQRPVSSTAQGPKTRAAQRNQLRPVTIDLNNMARPDRP